MKSINNIGERILLARKRKGLSLRALQSALGGIVSAQAIGKYERGEMAPGSKALLAIARVLEVPMTYLVSPQQSQLKSLEFRKKSGTSAKDRARVEAEVLESVERYLQVETILGLPSESWEAPFSPSPLREVEEAEAVAEQVRAEWKLGQGPIQDLTALLEDKGIKVLFLRLPDSVSGLTCLIQRDGKPDVPVIVVNAGHSLERRRHTLAHELAHRLIECDEDLVEKAVARIAGALLIPAQHLRDEVGEHRHSISYREIMLLKKLYKVSAISFWVRLYRLNIIDESTYQNAYRSFARSWRSSEPEALEDPMEPQEQPSRFQRLCYRALSEELISFSKASELLQLPVDSIERGLKGPTAD